MKIANIVCAYPPYRGGIGTAASAFRRYASENGFEVSTVTPDYGMVIDKNEDEKDGVSRLKPFFKLGNGAFLPQLFFRLRNFDLAYLHYPFFGGAEAVWLWKIFNPKKKIVIHYHMDVSGLSWLARILSLPSFLIAASLFKRADLIVSASFDYIKNSRLADLYHKNPEKFCEIPFGVDTVRFRPGEKAAGKPRFLFVGGLDRAHYFKGVDKLLEACALLKKDGLDNWELDIAGSGDLQAGYQKKAEELFLSDRVHFLGQVSDADLPGLYARSLALVLPSVNGAEAFGIVLIDALASGTPVIASNLPGVRSVFKDGVEGLLVRPGDAADLRDKLKKFLSDRTEAERMGKCSRDLAEEKYAQEKISARVADLLRRLSEVKKT